MEKRLDEGIDMGEAKVLSNMAIIQLTKKLEALL